MPPLPCPTCGSGQLALEKFHRHESKHTRDLEFEHHADGYDVRDVFIASLKCANGACGERVAMLGDAGLEEEYTGMKREWVDVLKSVALHPAPHMIGLPSGTPEDVVRALQTAFALYWQEPSAAASRVGIAIERQLTHLRVSRFENRGGKRHRLTLHARIKLLAQKPKYADIASKLLAVKWIRNEGTHGEVVEEDLFDALEILEHVLEELHDGKERRLARLASSINRRKGPRKAGKAPK